MPRINLGNRSQPTSSRCVDRGAQEAQPHVPAAGLRGAGGQLLPLQGPRAISSLVCGNWHLETNPANKVSRSVWPSGSIKWWQCTPVLGRLVRGACPASLQGCWTMRGGRGKRSVMLPCSGSPGSKNHGVVPSSSECPALNDIFSVYQITSSVDEL